MAVNIFINGMGVVGRQLLREIIAHPAEGIVFVGMNDPNITVDNLAYLLKYDSVYHGVIDPNSIIADADREEIIIEGSPYRLYKETDMNNLPLGDLGVDLVCECTGQAASTKTLQYLINAGAKKVLALYPLSDRDSVNRVAYGINQDTLKAGDLFIDMPTIEAQAAAILLKILNDAGVSSAICKSFGAYTNAQNTIDSLNKTDFALGRAGAWNISPIPSSADNYMDIGVLAPELDGKVSGFNYRAPVIVGGALDVSAVLDKIFSKQDILDLFSSMVQKSYSDVLAYADEPLVSSDVIALDKFQFLSDMTCVDTGGQHVSVCALYDNIRGVALQALRIVQYMINNSLM